ncbi:MAG: response regulator [Alistipes sp.]|nr:response regulator [Alistipes sp.]
MFIQSGITLGTLVFRQAVNVIQEYSISIMSRLVENRRVILENDMTQRWSSVYEQERNMNETVRAFLQEHHVSIGQVLNSEELKQQMLERLFPKCLEIVQNNLTTGIFLTMANGDGSNDGIHDGFFVRDSEPVISSMNYTDLLMERGAKELARMYNVSLDTYWSTSFEFEPQGERASDDFFYEPLRAGSDNPGAAIADLGYWSAPFILEDDKNDSHKMITYSVPLRYAGVTYAVLGVEISENYLRNYLPVSEINESEQSGYIIAVRNGDGSYTPMIGRGVLTAGISSEMESLELHETGYDGLFMVEGMQLGSQRIFAVVCPLKLYSTNVPYDNTDWVLIGLNTEGDLFGVSRQVYVMMIIGILAGLGFGVVCIYFLVKHLTKPIKRLMDSIRQGRTGLMSFRLSNIEEVDALYEVVNDLTERQRKSENALMEEKEMYRLALETTEDTFFSYDFQARTVDIVNHDRMNGHWEYGGGDIFTVDSRDVYEEDRKHFHSIIEEMPDEFELEFRLWYPEFEKYNWVLLRANILNDTEGGRWKLVGSFKNIQEEKEQELEEQRRNTLDGVTRLYCFAAGKEFLENCLEDSAEGAMILMRFDNLRQINEQNGIVFGDLILEEIGRIIRRSYQTVAMRFDGNEILIWLSDCTKEDAKEYCRDIQDKIRRSFDDDLFGIRLRIGIVMNHNRRDFTELARKAKAAQLRTNDRDNCRFYEDIDKKYKSSLPALHGKQLITTEYGDDINMVSLALNLFGKGDNLGAQMALLLRKVGYLYNAEDVQITIVRPDFRSNYLEYQWHRKTENKEEVALSYTDEEWDAFMKWIGGREILRVSGKDCQNPVIQKFLHFDGNMDAVTMPMYDSGAFMGMFTLTGVSGDLAENGVEKDGIMEIHGVIQSQLNQQRHDLASKAKSNFLSRMSHEIRTPMNGIIGMTTIALSEGQSKEKMVECLEKIQNSSDYLLGLINDILDMSKIESGKMHLETVNFSMKELLGTITELITPQAKAKNIEFVRDVKTVNDWFVGDRMRISQVLINLLGNAVKFTPEHGRVQLTIRETQGEDNSALYFEVLDTGVGISKENQKRVFKSFEQVGGPNSSKLQGTGLGLSISSRLIQLMGSSIELSSEPGEGSKFSFEILLPVGKEEEVQEEQEEFSFEGYRILVVEDNELNSEIARSLLEEAGFEVECVYDGAQAVARMEETKPHTYDVILMDIMMPVMDGLDATRAIRASRREDLRKIPIIAMSANAFDDDLKKSVECGMNGHLSKPVEVDKLYRMLAEVIHKK